jgi:hypothetical protein
MIMAPRIPALTERMRAATIRAAEAQQAMAGPTGPTETVETPERRKVTPERLAA